MSRYIDADALKEGIKELKQSPWYNNDINPSWKQGIKDAVHVVETLCIDEAPTVDAVPVRHGKWIKGSETKRIKENRYGVLFDAYYCSACESEAYWNSDYGQILFHYCPNCGARMDEE